MELNDKTKKNKKMKKIILLAIAIFVTTSSYSQEEKYPSIGIGFQTSFKTYGLSAKINITEKHTAQAFISLIGSISSYVGRYSYSFKQSGNLFKVKPYVFGQVGFYSFENSSVRNTITDMISEESERALGYGVGGGIEYYVGVFNNKFRASFDIGYGKVNFAFTDFKSVFIGIGFHYHFNL